MTVPTIPLSTFCAWRARRAGLGQAAATPPPEPRGIEAVLATAGWLLAPGSTAPYLSLRLRSAACSREAVSQAVLRDRSLVRVTSVRGEPHFVPHRQVMVAIAAKGRRIDARIRQINKVVSISRGEVETLGMAILELLGEGPATIKKIEEGLPGGMLRSFGTEGRRAGVPGVLPVALEHLEEEGRVLHLDSGKRLDDGKRVYLLTEMALPECTGCAPDQLQVLPDVLHTYLESFGPARVEDFVWWAGTTLNRASAAAEALQPPPVVIRVEGLDGDRLALPEDLESLARFEGSAPPEVALLPNRDPFYLGRKALNREFLDFEAPERVLARFRGKPVAARVLPTVVVNGRIVGVWEWRSRTREIQWALFDSASTAAWPAATLAAAIRREADWLTAFIREELDGKIVMDPRERGMHWAYGIDEIRSFW
ncbi:MAG: winged helix DNA-binding domain-containing protein [Planctomycetes bacterium]|nr:winged helix DNA-binding domain-containing protein [Planctomycetota bacterium]